ncbi:hypothetical protein B0H16DRAFT_1571649 [Mycena metata]|uniref:Uncharacterized protein n=1 Tax=Mycena metata TaxID=1033252 RepID=A0AAD7IAR0_9AGAR|nr:hypothetical protein B0H16DRAFT_1571649 [Mycena metata]
MDSSPSEPTLLSGDKQLLVKRGTGCEIWDIAQGRRIWAHAGVFREHIAVQPVEDNRQLLLVTCTGEPLSYLFANLNDPAQIDCKHVVRFLLVDLTTDTETLFMSVRLPPTFAQVCEPVIAGDFWAATVHRIDRGGNWDTVVLIVNHKEQRFILLNCKLVHKNILDGHLLALTVTKTALKSEVILFPASSFEEAHWQPFTSEALTAAAPVRIEPLVLQRAEYPFLLASTPFVSVHRCILRSGSYMVSTHAASPGSRDRNDPRRPSFHRYRLTLPTSGSAPPNWEWIFSAGTLADVSIDSFTYAGYGLSFWERRRLEPRVVLQFHPATATNVDGQRALPLAPNAPGRVSLSPGSGALTVCSAHGVDVYYYE